MSTKSKDSSKSTLEDQVLPKESRILATALSETQDDKIGPWKVILSNQIRSKLLPKNGDIHKQFLPIDDLVSILSTGPISNLIGEVLKCGSETSRTISSKIMGTETGCEPSLKILAILIMIERAEYITRFIEHGIQDDKLPLLLNYQADIFRDWSPHEADTFCEKQYMVLAPVFDFTRVDHFDWDKKIRMPFLDKLEWKTSGAHGVIAQIKIHSRHQLRGTDSTLGFETNRFALKKFRVPAKDFEQERDALRRFSDARNGHKNLIKLLLSYNRDNKHYLVFPWAQGNLVEFWKKTPSNPNSGHHSKWLIKQCLDISDGLNEIHGNRERLADQTLLGRHGDIKPENILYFDEPDSGQCHLVVADFTLMRFHSTNTVHHTDANRVDFSKTYRAPEVMQASRARVDQSYDVWTLGCVYLEFVTWYLIGYAAIREKDFRAPTGEFLDSFQTMREKEDGNIRDPDDRFFYYHAWFPKVKKLVRRWIKMLHRNEHCSDAMHDFLALIENHMLVPSPGKRYAMSEVRDTLRQIAIKCQRDDDYCYKGSPERSLGEQIRELCSLARSYLCGV